MANLKTLAIGLICMAVFGNCGNVIVGNGNRVIGNNNVLHNSNGNHIDGDNNFLRDSLRNQINGDWNRFYSTNDLLIHGHDHYFNNGE